MTWPSPGSPNVRPCCPDEKFRVSIGFPEGRETGTTLLQALRRPTPSQTVLSVGSVERRKKIATAIGGIVIHILNQVSQSGSEGGIVRRNVAAPARQG
jgi:hypothetical protein